MAQQAGCQRFGLSPYLDSAPAWLSRHRFPKAPLCHELGANATFLSIDLLPMHFLSCFDVIVVSVCGRFQIKLWRVLSFKLVISGDYSAAVELTFLFFFLATNRIMWLCCAEVISNAHRWRESAMSPLHCKGNRCWLGLLVGGEGAVVRTMQHSTVQLGFRARDLSEIIHTQHQMWDKEIIVLSRNIHWCCNSAALCSIF